MTDPVDKLSEEKPKDGKWAKLAKLIKKVFEISAYEHIDGYVSAPMGRTDDEVRTEARSLSGGLPDKAKGKLVDRLIEGAKAKREKAAKQRADGKGDLADRTEAQARALEVAADELNKQLHPLQQRKVKIGGGGEPAGQSMLRPGVLIPAGVVAVALVGVGILVASSGGDGGDDFPAEATTPVLNASAAPVAVATGNFTISGSGVDLSGPYIARISDGTCADYAATGDGKGTYNVPTPGYRSDVEYPFEVYSDLSITGYQGPGTYSGSDLGGGVDVLQLEGGGPSVRSNGSKAFSVTTRPDGSGRVRFAGTDERALVSGSERTVGGSMSWTCDEVRLDGGYVLAHAQ